MSLGNNSTTTTSVGNNHYVASLLNDGYRWTDPTVHFSFKGFSADERKQIYNAEVAWGSVANLSFQHTNGSKAEIRFNEEQLNLLTWYGYSGTPYEATDRPGKASTGYTTNSWKSIDGTTTTTFNNTGLGAVYTHLSSDSPAFLAGINGGQAGFEVFVHEIGHALGLKHPFDAGADSSNKNYFNGVSSTYDFGDNRLNQGVYTIMSYNNNYDPSAKGLDYKGYIKGPMAFDIAAIQQLYGARTTSHAGASYYQLYDSKSPADKMGWQCIWDTSGTDTIGYDGKYNAVIDLRPATLDDSPTGGGMMSYTWGVNKKGDRVMHSQGYTIAGDVMGALHNKDGFHGVLIEKGIGGSGRDSITGNDADNQLVGNAGNDTLIGGLGNDTLIGGTGADAMRGGAGDDIYVIDNPNDIYSEMNYRHRDSGGIDVVETTLTHFTLTENDRSQIENLTYKGFLSFFGTGNSLDNTIIGGRAGDVLTGGLGNDTLDGRGGGDTMIGGAGDDTYVVDSADDIVDESDGEGDAGGIDTIRTSLSFYRLDDPAGARIENLTLTSTEGAGGVGNDLDNTITGNRGDDFLEGNGGNDTLIGLGGRDSLIGGDGNDTYVISDAAAVIVEYDAGVGGIDLVQTRLTSYTLTDNVENLTFTDLSIRRRAHTGTGNALDNAIRGGDLGDTLSGLDGNDYLYGNGGKDTLQGGAGNDILRGGAGDDLLNGGAGIDAADYHDMTSKTDINLRLGIARVLKSASAEVDTLVSIENIIGGQNADTVVGDDNDNAFIYQGWYNRFSSSGGVDKFDGAGGSDTIDFADFRVQMMTIDLGAGTAVGRYSVDAGTGTKNGSKTVLTFSHVENVVASRGDDTIFGDSGDNVFYDAGAFRYQHQVGGTDRYYGGQGNDTVDFSRYDGTLDIDLERGDAQAFYHVSVQGGSESAASIVAYLSGIENVTGSFDNDTIKGDANDNTFSYVGTFSADKTQGGSDSYDGRGGVNTIDMSKFHGRTDIDLTAGIVSSSYSYDTGEGMGTATAQLALLANIQNAVGSALADTIEGTGEANRISGGGGNDRITGNGGSDRLTGGAGTDTFVFGAGFGHDVITDFVTLSSRRGLHDVIEFSTSVFADWDHVLAATTDTENGAVITAPDAANTITLIGVTKQSLTNHHESDFVFV